VSGIRGGVVVRFTPPATPAPGPPPPPARVSSVSKGGGGGGGGVDFLSPSSVEIKERVELYLYSHLGLMACYRVNFTYFPFCSF